MSKLPTVEELHAAADKLWPRNELSDEAAEIAGQFLDGATFSTEDMEGVEFDRVSVGYGLTIAMLVYEARS